jgi:hypothetical protein
MVNSTRVLISENIDRTRNERVSLEDADRDDIAYWMSKSRIECIEYLRRWAYDEDQVDARFQSVLEFAELDRN